MHPKYLKLFLFLIKVITIFFFFFLSITSLRQVIYLKEIKKIMKHLPMYILVAFVGGVAVEPIKREVSKFVCT